MNENWIDFKQLREKLDLKKVLEHYRIELKTRRGAQHQGFCPLPTHQGQRRSPSFSVNLERGIWQCFGCGAKGNALDLCVRLEGLNPENGRDVRTVALKLQQVFRLEPSNAPPQRAARPLPRSAPQAQHSAQEKAEQVPTRPAIVNAPLDFELKDLDEQHPYLLGRGFTPETIAFFGIGFCSRGTFQGRIVIPLHDAKGQLVGYAGRLVDDKQISEQNPRYKFPPSRLRNDEVHEFRKSLVLYNASRIKGPVSDVVVCEGFTAAWWLHQNGFPHVVSVMGASCSPEQAEHIVQLVAADGRVWVMSDGNEAGQRCAASVLTQMAPHRLCRWAKLQDGEQPTDCSAEELAALLRFESKQERRKRSCRKTEPSSSNLI